MAEEISKIQIRRGLKKDLPILSDAEFGLCTDTKELFIGTDAGNILLARKSDIPTTEGKTIIEPSTTNGYIVVDGVPFKVFDETSLMEAINGKVSISDLSDMLSEKADKNHTHDELHIHSNQEVLDGIEEAYTTTEKEKLSGIELGAEKNKVTSVNGQVGDVVIECSGSGVLTFDTLEELQTLYPNGISQPVWIESEHAWYYWDNQ